MDPGERVSRSVDAEESPAGATGQARARLIGAKVPFSALIACPHPL